MSELSRIAQEESKMEMTPMIDVTFLLLIFFMCTIKFKILEGKLAAYLPKDVGVNSSSAEPIEKVEITVKVINEGTKLDPTDAGKAKSRNPSAVKPWSGIPGTRYVWADDRILEFRIGPKRTNDLEELEKRLKRLHEDDEERPATIDPRKGTVYEDVVGVLDRAINAGFEDITFVGSYED